MSNITLQVLQSTPGSDHPPRGDGFADFTTVVWSHARRLGLNIGLITDAIIRDLFPHTSRAAEDEGADVMLRSGVGQAVRKQIKKPTPIGEQIDLSRVDPPFHSIALELRNHTYFVESLGEFKPVHALIRNPALLDEARKYLQRKGLETLAEADRLDDLYEAVVARA